MNRWPYLRDIVLFVSGMMGVIHETLFAATERPTLLILFAAMLGLPAFLQQSRNEDKGLGKGSDGEE